ncbi:DUF808 domain-containing protein [Timonella sp. A28]|uniref:DUF808 domain-containing protein n=1 Tax=Timonella sp. A28 TaxID=3442640 RepID=UPI003EBE5D69
MASGFFALLDDIALLAKAAASSIDDMAAAAAKASAKSLGVVIDDAAVTPQYVQGIAPSRELPVIKRITIGSLRNKFLVILPIALVLTTWAPWALPILLIIGGTYLAFEGAEKVLGWFGVHLHGDKKHAVEEVKNSEEFESSLVRGAVRTDLILSAEIMLIALSNVGDHPFWEQVGILAIIALMMTAGVYGVVALLVKMDDVGVRLAQSPKQAIAGFGRGLVKGMPRVFNVLSTVGTIAMLWVGGHIVAKSLYDLGFKPLYNIAHDIAHWFEGFSGAVGAWCGDTIYSAFLGLGVGLLVVGVVAAFGKVRHQKAAH